ncbi:hypothetical protein M5F00_07845 [Acinetobacter sp. ANC 4945]|uniref:Uncharacterized protein n=1 Tax=Acinetobacter amyesii TaxID=2942470 RepID=A0A1T1H0L2_9GAMM|nr:hypothetical protein [Acinetobacter amyesii]MCL6247771.1 hypothetical protein [Acinetobacter amyesii]OOV83409.1 hypothetical protein B1202_07110 [Acinetobacter amyesii]
MQLEQAFKEANIEASHLALRTIHTDLRSRVAGTLFTIAQQHQYSIFLLLQNSPALHASAFTLLRPLCEAVIKGLWVKLAATDIQIDKILKGKFIKNTDQMVKLISAKYQSSKAEINPLLWEVINSYTHSGHIQLQNWIYSESVEPHYSDEAIAELIKLTRLASNLAFHATHTISTEH